MLYSLDLKYLPLPIIESAFKLDGENWLAVKSKKFYKSDQESSKESYKANSGSKKGELLLSKTNSMFKNREKDKEINNKEKKGTRNKERAIESKLELEKKRPIKALTEKQKEKTKNKERAVKSKSKLDSKKKRYIKTLIEK